MDGRMDKQMDNMMDRQTDWWADRPINGWICNIHAKNDDFTIDFAIFTKALWTNGPTDQWTDIPSYTAASKNSIYMAASLFVTNFFVRVLCGHKWNLKMPSSLFGAISILGSINSPLLPWSSSWHILHNAYFQNIIKNKRRIKFCSLYFPPQTTLFYAGDLFLGYFIIKRGLVLEIDLLGNVLVRGPGETVGVASLWVGQQMKTTITQTYVNAFWVDSQLFVDALQQCPAGEESDWRPILPQPETFFQY